MRRELHALLSLFIAFSSNGNLSALAQPSTSSEAQLGKLERLLFGNVRDGAPLEQRLDMLETNVFGERKTGNISARLEALGKVVNPGSAMTLMPPQAPALDLGQAEPAAAPDRERKQGHVDFSVNQSPGLNDLLKQGTESYRAGRLDDAEKSFRQVLSRDRNNADALYNLGALSEQRGDLDGALNYYRLALSANPQDEQLRATVNEITQELAKRQAAGARAQDAETRAQEAEARAQAAEARAQAAESRAQAAQASNQAGQAFNLKAQKSYAEEVARYQNQISQPPMIPVSGMPTIRLPAIRMVSGGRARGVASFSGGGTSFLRSATGFALNGARLGINIAAWHCPKCRRFFFGK